MIDFGFISFIESFNNFFKTKPFFIPQIIHFNINDKDITYDLNFIQRFFLTFHDDKIMSLVSFLIKFLFNMTILLDAICFILSSTNDYRFFTTSNINTLLDECRDN
jgi:hypothetical protein